MSDTLDLTKFEEHIYNTYLRVSRSRNDQPFRLRKDFNSLTDSAKISVKKLSLFFIKFDHIKVEDFFNAPYSIYTDEKYFDLDYFTTLKATKAYALYQKKKIYNDIDSDEQLLNIKESLQYILKFCKDENLPLSEYLSHKDSITPSFLVHLKEHKVNVFTLLGLNNFKKALLQLDIDTVKFIISEELFNQIDNLRVRLYNSKKARILIERGLQKVQKILQENS